MNVAEQISTVAQLYPAKLSVICPKIGNRSYQSYTFKNFEKRINQFSNRLLLAKVKKGDKVLVFIKPNIDFAAIVFSIFRIGAVGVFIDPGMGKNKLLDAIEESGANVLIGINKVHVLRRIYKNRFKKIKVFLTNGKSSILAKSLYKGLKKQSTTFQKISTDINDLAAVLYTSGGTGKPKGVLYTHKIFIEQTAKLQKEFNLTHNDIDLAGFPLFAMFTLSMGMSSVIPYMDPSRPAKASGAALLKNIKDHDITFVAGSPAIWTNLLNLCSKQSITLDSVKFLVMFGAPIPYDTHFKFSKILNNGSTYTPYGATECLPVSNISGKQILEEFSPEHIIGKGICIGHPLDGVDVKIIKVNLKKLNMDEIEILDNFEIGEIIISSSTVTSGYFNLTHKTELSKIMGDKLWHRMGDTGYLDDKGRIWFTGRVAHSFSVGFKEFYPVPMEQFFTSITGVEKAAFVKVSDHRTCIIIQGANLALEEIKDVIYRNDLQVDYILFHPKFPVDVRHNIKIDRKVLSVWAKKSLGL